MFLRFRQYLTEAPVTYVVPPPSQFVVDYYAVTPSGTRGRLTMRSGLTQIRGARSETAVLAYLTQKHKPCSIEILRLDFK